MTPEERASGMMYENRLLIFDSEMARFSLAAKLRSEIATAIRSAVAEDREACAAIAEEPASNPLIDVGNSIPSVCHAIAAAIRARGEGDPAPLTDSAADALSRAVQTALASVANLMHGPEERVAALAWCVEHLYAFSDEHEKARTLRILSCAKKAAGPEGWRFVAYQWLEESRKIKP